ncbi:MAG: Fe-S protein assembly chaperone HscA [Ignavibacteria bacterium]|nr:Fe-S protein assembly chaperone HscA [Ignavibacteria bacterium]
MLQIEIPKHLKKNDVIVGIDLGTTNSLIAYVDENAPKIIANEGEDKLVPSVIYIDNEKNIMIGSAAKKHLITDTDKTVYSVKRLMGKSYEDIQGDSHLVSYNISEKAKEGLVRLTLAEKDYSPIELSSFILSELKERAEKYFGHDIKKCVITVPAYFNDSQRQATKDAGKIAGIDVLRIINEPTAAALAYGLDKNVSGSEEKIIAVYDLGGGTFDISILKLKDGIFEVLATHGDTYLGGDDFDKALMDYLIKEINQRLSKQDLSKLREIAEDTKKKLTYDNEVEINEELPDSKFKLNKKITREKFESLIKSIVDKTKTACKAAIRDSKVDLNKIDTVVMVGGSTRVPLVIETVESIFGKKPFNEIDPDDVVALGAAVQADILAGNRKDILLLDVNPLSLGIETIGGVMSVLIPRNTTIPTQQKETYTTFMDNQTGVVINVFQGEREFVKDNRSLAQFILKGITPQPAGMPKIEVSFIIDTDGILRVRAKDLKTNKEQEIEVKPSYGLTYNEIETMIVEGLKNARTDMKERTFIETKTDAERLIHAVEKVLETRKEAITREESENINSLLSDLKAAIEAKNTELVKQIQEKLDKETEPLAHRIMDDSINKALKDKSLQEL